MDLVTEPTPQVFRFQTTAKASADAYVLLNPRRRALDVVVDGVVDGVAVDPSPDPTLPPGLSWCQPAADRPRVHRCCGDLACDRSFWPWIFATKVRIAHTSSSRASGARLTLDGPLTAKDRPSAAAPMAVLPLDLPLPAVFAAGGVTPRRDESGAGRHEAARLPGADMSPPGRQEAARRHGACWTVAGRPGPSCSRRESVAPGATPGPWGLEAQRSIVALREPARRQAGSRETGTDQMMHPRTRMAEDPVMHAPESAFEPLATLSSRLQCRRGPDFGTSFGHTSPGMTG